MNEEQEKIQAAKSFEKKYKNRRGFKSLFKKAQRVIYRKDILQPQQREFEQVYAKTWKDRALMHDAAERAEIRRQKEIEEAYAKKQKGIVTLEQKTLKELQLEHPTMIKEEDINKWQ